MTPLADPPPCQPDPEDPEPPPSTPSACLPSQSHLPCLPPRAPAPIYHLCVPIRRHIRAGSRWKSGWEGSVSRGLTREVEGRVGMGMGMGMRISGIMEDMEISGCLMISVLRSLLRRGGDECLERMRMERRTGMRRGIEEVGGVDDNTKGTRLLATRSNTGWKVDEEIVWRYAIEQRHSALSHWGLRLVMRELIRMEDGSVALTDTKCLKCKYWQCW
jgi:hypothetical protein